MMDSLKVRESFDPSTLSSRSSKADPSTLIKARITALKEEYQNIATYCNANTIQFSLLNEFLKKQGILIEFQVLLDIFDRQDRGASPITQEEYVKAILKNEDLVREQISNKNRNIRDYQKKIEKYKNSKEEKLITEHINPLTKLSDDSSITVTIKDIKNLPKLMSASFNLQFDNERYKTKTLANSQTPVWDETFVFSVKNDNQMLIITLISKELVSDKVIGKIFIRLNDFEDQFIHDDWVAIEGTDIQVHLSIQYIYSQVKYLESLITRMEEELTTIRPERNQLAGFLDKITERYGMFLHYTEGKLSDLKSHKDNNYQADEYNTVKMKSSLGNSSQIDSEQPLESITKPSIMYGIPLLSCSCVLLYLLIMIKRADMFNVCCCLYIFNSAMNDSIVKNHSLIKRLMILGFIWDIVWYYNYVTPYALGYLEEKKENGIRKLALFFSFVVTGIKVFLYNNLSKFNDLSKEGPETKN